MRDETYRIFPLGDSALTVEFGNEISIDLNERALSLADHFDADPFPGFIEAVPAYASATVVYDLIEVRRSFPAFATAFDAVAYLAKAAITKAGERKHEPSRLVEIPIDVGRDAAPDLDFVAGSHGFSANEVIDIFTSTIYRVFMLGFLPGFAYMGEVDAAIATPRKETPRLSVPRGSVGIAGRQTGVYSLDSPGGWHIIGRTDIPMFMPDRQDPCYLRPGDRVRFVAKT